MSDGPTITTDGTVLQRTLKSSISCTGVGLHSGRKIAMMLHPAGADTGIRIRRTDLPAQPTIPVTWKHVADTQIGRAHV